MENSTLDKSIGEYILSHKDGDYSDIFEHDERLEIAEALAPLSYGLLAWYPFDKNGEALQIGSNFGAMTELLSRRLKNVTVIDEYEYRAVMTQTRFENIKNIQVRCELFSEFIKQNIKKYKYIICTVDDNLSFLSSEKEYLRFIKKVKSILSQDGKFLFTVPNRLGIKYFCGNTDSENDCSFDGITDNLSKIYRLDKQTLIRLFDDAGFKHTKIYYPFPDYKSPQFIYTDEKKPSDEFIERPYAYFTSFNHDCYINEWELACMFAKQGVLDTFVNAFLVEAGYSENCDAEHIVINSARNRSQIFATAIHKDIVRKIPLCEQGMAGINKLISNCNELKKHNIPVIDMKKTDDGIEMKKITAPSLVDIIRQSKDRNKVLSYFDRLWNYILNSSEHMKPEDNYLYDLAPDADWGVILKYGNIEMIPINCFIQNDEFIFFDQEYMFENCPAKLVFYRVLLTTYIIVKSDQIVVTMDELKHRYGVDTVWDYLVKASADIDKGLSNSVEFCGLSYWNSRKNNFIIANRRKLFMSDKFEGSFDIVSGLEEQRIILFGSGKYADYYLDEFEKTQPPIFIVDNNEEKWGTRKRGYDIKNPSEIRNLSNGTFTVIVTVAKYEPIAEQLRKMGIYNYRIFNRKVAPLLSVKISNTMIDGKYNIGYVSGVFDLFHIGHLNLFKKCKERCHYLIAGVIDDEVASNIKNKVPFVPFEERLEIVKQCKYIDRVYRVGDAQGHHIDQWSDLKYGCLFSGDDHASEPEWKTLKKQLCTLGSNIEFFPYTKSTSSSMLQKALKDSVRDKNAD